MGPVIFLPVFYSVLTVFPPRHRVCARGYLNTELINDSTEKGDYIVLIPEKNLSALGFYLIRAHRERKIHLVRIWYIPALRFGLLLFLLGCIGLAPLCIPGKEDDYNTTMQKMGHWHLPGGVCIILCLILGILARVFAGGCN